MLIDQKGIPGKDAARMMLGDRFGADGDDFVRIRREYETDNLKNIEVFEGFTETASELENKGFKIGICTSANPEFFSKMLEIAPQLNKFSRHVVMKGDYVRGKPDAEPLLTTFRKMEITNSEAIYVGDAFADFEAAKNAESKFVYFCNGERDNRIPSGICRIEKHSQLLNLLNLNL